METMDELESREIIEHGSDRVEQQGGKTSQALEEMVGVEFGSLHEALKVEGQESREHMIRNLVATDDGHNQGSIDNTSRSSS